jgi:hypothetical protein
LIAELFASNQERIHEENVKRESNKNRLMQEASTLGSPSKEQKKGRGINPTFDVSKVDHRLGPAVRRKQQDLSKTTPNPMSGKIKLSSSSSASSVLNQQKKEIGFSMTGSQLPHLVKGKR